MNASKTETNPGEFPWVVAIFEKAIDPLIGKRKFLSSGSLMDRDVVATVAHNVIPFQGCFPLFFQKIITNQVFRSTSRPHCIAW